MEKQVNIDYIGVINFSNGKATFKQEKIEKLHTELIQSLKDMVKNENKTVLDLQGHFTRIFNPDKAIKSYNYCYPYHYNDSFISDATYPKLRTFQEYKNEVLKFKNEQELELRKDEQFKDSENALKEEIETLVNQYIFDLKDQFSQEAERYINAFNFSNKLKKLKDNANNKMFSSETIGWTDYEYSINKDITYHLKSNFGYGRSSYFFVNLKYRGIDILPYSEIVKYYYARMIDLIRYTRLYSVNRGSWDIALDFVESTSNRIVNDPKDFVEKWIFNEIDEMMSGLRRIALNPKKSHNEIMNRKCDTEGLLTVRNITNYQKELYKIYPSEMTVAFQAEKITGALYFLDNLKKLENIYPRVKNTINEIINMNQTSYDYFRHSLESMNFEIDNKQKKVTALEKEAKRIDDLCAPHIKAIEDIINKAKEENKMVFRSSLVKNYMESHEEYAQLNNKRIEINEDINNNKSDLYNRQSFADRLSECVAYVNKVLYAA